MPLKVIQPGEDVNASKHEHETSQPAEHKPETHKPAQHHAAHHPPSTTEKLSYLFIAIVALVLVFNGIQLMQLSNGSYSTGVAGPITAKSSGGVKLDASNDVVNQVIKTIIPTGTPQDYGQELAVSFDDPVAGLSTLAKLDRAIPTSTLTAEQKQRYLNTATRISCEYCCGAPAVADQNGRDLCGCAHSLAIRGLTKYLVTQHPTTWTDDQIYWEVTRWKALFYPKNSVEKGVALVNNNMEITAAALNDRDLLKKIQSGSTDIGSLPNMVGGC